MEGHGRADASGATLVDLLALVRRRGWSPARISALRNTCAAAAGKDSMPAEDRALAAAVAAALTGRSPGISRAHLDVLERTALLDPAAGDEPG